MVIALLVEADIVTGDRSRGEVVLPVGVDRMDVPPAGADPCHVWLLLREDDALPAEADLMGVPQAGAEVKYDQSSIIMKSITEEVNHAHKESLISTLVTPRLPKDVTAKLITRIKNRKSKEVMPQQLLNHHQHDPCLVLVAWPYQGDRPPEIDPPPPNGCPRDRIHEEEEAGVDPEAYAVHNKSHDQTTTNNSKSHHFPPRIPHSKIHPPPAPST
mmetsp:Transcript_36997/g.67879  ORF Transcript_36997/g.67879 Transcript_36997/m.67879 type:complete len:215 (-) Transcript_36997:870-1514(-)